MSEFVPGVAGGGMQGVSMKIVIAGQYKSGTTAILTKIRSAMPASTLVLFEPRGYEASTASDVLAKILIDNPDYVDFASFDSFDRKILIVRDPRDNMVSRVLYRIFEHPDFCLDDDKVAQFVGLLRKKEADPKSVSLLELIGLFNRLKGVDTLGRLTKRATRGLEFHAERPDYFVYRYEDLVQSAFAPLESYLGLRLTHGAATVDRAVGRVTRTKGSGDWRNWFLEADVAFFRPHFATYMEHYGYGVDWSAAENPVVRPDHASEYVLRLVQEKRTGSKAQAAS